LLVLGVVFSYLAFARSVGQVQTTKFFAPETVQLLKARVAAGQPTGFQVEDLVSYIVQFSPIANGAVVGANGYIADYIPPGTDVVGVFFVSKSGTEVVAGDTYDKYITVAPSLPGGLPAGLGSLADNTYFAPFNVPTYDTAGRCTAAAFTKNCNGRLSDVYAYTGIFYSTGLAPCPNTWLMNTPVLIASTTFFSTGVTIGAFPANSSATLLVACGVTSTAQ
jgi:hypothetical protein